MASALGRIRVKANNIDDPDPITGFQPPEVEIFKPPSSEVIGVRVGLVYLVGGFTATVTLYARNATDGTWFRTSPSGNTNVPNRQLIIQDDLANFDIWVRLTAITGGNPIEVLIQEVIHRE